MLLLHLISRGYLYMTNILLDYITVKIQAYLGDFVVFVSRSPQ